MLGQREACLGNVAAARAAFTLGLRKCSGGVPLWAAAVATEEAAGNVYALHTHRTSHVAAKGGSLTTVSRSDIRLIQYSGSSAPRPILQSKESKIDWVQTKREMLSFVGGERSSRWRWQSTVARTKKETPADACTHRPVLALPTPADKMPASRFRYSPKAGPKSCRDACFATCTVSDNTVI